MLRTSITSGLLLAVAFLFSEGATTSAYALMSKHRCYFCHDLHSAAGGSLTNLATSEAVCQACHYVSVDGRTYGTDTDAVSTAAVAVHTGTHFPANRISCLGCHDPHDYRPTDDPATAGVVETNDGIRDSYQNLDLVLRTITVMPFPVTAVFTDTDSTDGSYDYADGSGDGICQGCHTLTSSGTMPRMRNDGSGSAHQLGNNCMNCHPHSNGFDR